ncbi:response regulator [Candidatus Woesearchaeota archaeon]|nr:response regulator [Candidatus Woesearchaeota archaeon]
MLMKKRILIVEDDESHQEFLRQALKDDYELVVVGRLDNAMKELNKGKFDLMLLDILLPDGSGDSLLAKIRGIPRFNNLRVICMTILGNLEEGMIQLDPRVRCLAKPFSEKTLKETINEVLPEE